jgi:anti-sigma regulatory factor (Ser/Thr protein kinase)
VRWARTFPADPRSVPAARHFATDVLSDVSPELLQVVELMVSELATNGIRHARSTFELAIYRTVDRVRVEVTDQAGGTPSICYPAPDDPTGRGLRIVDMLAEQWGVERSAAVGKTVWFTVAAPPQTQVAG